MEVSRSPIDFVHGLTFDDLPVAVVGQAKRCLLDLIGVAASGRQTALSRIVHGFAVSQMGAAAGKASEAGASSETTKSCRGCTKPSCASRVRSRLEPIEQGGRRQIGHQ